MKINGKMNIRYLVELVITLLLILFVVVVLTKVFATAKLNSVYAKDLNEAVLIAENVAELGISSHDREEFLDKISKVETVKDLSDGDEITFSMSLSPETAQDRYLVRATFEEESYPAGKICEMEVSIMDAESRQEIYCISTGKYRGGDHS
ncbi:MAG: hypothetical protein IKI62_05235 [Clostridia bacterium]|nr:hypothetical protein [Clostridia bacterium]